MSPKDLNLPGGCKSFEEFVQYLLKKIRECVVEKKSKIETENHLWDKFNIDHRFTRMCFFRLREKNPDVSSDVRKIHEQVETEKKNNLPGNIEDLANYIMEKIKEERINDRPKDKKKLSEIMVNLSEKYNIDRRYTLLCLAEQNSEVSNSLLEDLRKKHEQIETEKKTSAARAQATQVDSKANQSTVAKPNVVINLPSGYYRVEDVVELADNKVRECIKDNLSKEATVKYLLERFQVSPYITIAVWDDLQNGNPDFFNMYNFERAQEKLTRETNAAKRDLATAELLAAEREYCKSSKITSEENAPKKPKTQLLQASQKTVSTSASEKVGVVKHVLTKVNKMSEQMLKLMDDEERALGLSKLSAEDLNKILTNANTIASNSEKMIKLMTDATESEEKQPVEQEQVSSDNEETEDEKMDTTGSEDSESD